MTPPIAEMHDTQILSFKDFVDSVFTELNSPTNEWYVDLSEYGYGYYNPTYWENTLIPLAIRLYELALNDVTIYWWLIREMSLVDLFKASKEDFRKREIFEVLLQLKPEHRRIILENSVPKHAEELQKALDNDDLETFRSLLPLIADDNTIYHIGRVLMRIDEVRVIFKRTIRYTKGDSLGRLFVLFRAYYRYFSDEYKYNKRYCDGLANNVFLALYQTQYREDKVDFCDVANKIGKLWVKNLILDYFLNKDRMPKSVRDVLYNILQSKSTYDYHDLEEELSNCDNEEHIEDLKKRVGGWLDLENKTDTFRVFDQEWRKTLPPFSCRCLNVRRRVRRPVQRNGNVERHNVQDNCVPYIDSKNAIPMEDLEMLKAQEANKNVGNQKPVAVSDSDSKPAAKDSEHDVKDEAVKSDKEFKPIYFPDDWGIPIDKHKEFLTRLHGKLKDVGYLRQDCLNDFIFIFSGYDDIPKENFIYFKPVNWGKESDRDYSQLQAFCIALFKMRMGPNEHKKSPWKKLTPLFTVNGEPIKDLCENASKTFQDKQSIENMLERITDAQKETLY